MKDLEFLFKIYIYFYNNFINFRSCILDEEFEKKIQEGIIVTGLRPIQYLAYICMAQYQLTLCQCCEVNYKKKSETACIKCASLKLLYSCNFCHKLYTDLINNTCKNCNNSKFILKKEFNTDDELSALYYALMCKTNFCIKKCTSCDNYFVHDIRKNMNLKTEYMSLHNIEYPANMYLSLNQMIALNEQCWTCQSKFAKSLQKAKVHIFRKIKII